MPERDRESHAILNADRGIAGSNRSADESTLNTPLPANELRTCIGANSDLNEGATPRLVCRGQQSERPAGQGGSRGREHRCDLSGSNARPVFMISFDIGVAT
jgi:hypothetical protein